MGAAWAQDKLSREQKASAGMLPDIQLCLKHNREWLLEFCRDAATRFAGHARM
jgi:hypothetical protein